MVLMLLCWAFLGNDGVAERYQAHVQFLADDLLEGRETSFRGQKLASRYLATQLALAGAEPAFPESDQPYYQTFDVAVRGIDFEQLQAGVKARGRTIPLQVNRDFQMRTLGMDNLDVSAPMVFVGYGLELEGYNEYASVKVKDRWAVMFEGQPTGAEGSIFAEELQGARLFRKVMLARQKGALGVIIMREGSLTSRSGVGPGHRFSLIDEEKEPRKPTKPFAMIVVPEDRWEKFFDRDLEKIKARKEAIASTSKPQSFTIRKRDFSLAFSVKEEVRDTENVVAILPGSDPVLKNEYVVVSAHFDHVGLQNGTVYNGADDNASGSATLLMLARDFAQKDHRRSLVILLVSGEESGLLGSSHFVKNPPMPKAQIVANVNMDMIGRHKTGEIGVIPSAVKGISTLNQILEEVNEASDFRHTLIKNMDRYNKRSDHYNFAKNEIPAIFFFAGVHDDYHGPDDDWQKLNYEKLEKLYGLMSPFLLKVLNAPEKPVFLEVPEEEKEADAQGR